MNKMNIRIYTYSYIQKCTQAEGRSVTTAAPPFAEAIIRGVVPCP